MTRRRRSISRLPMTKSEGRHYGSDDMLRRRLPAPRHELIPTAGWSLLPRVATRDGATSNSTSYALALRAWKSRSLLLVKVGSRAFNISQTWRLLRSEEHTSELQSLMRTSYAVFCLQ